MHSVTRPLFDLTAEDLMTTALTVIPREMSLQAAARLLLQAQVSGAPVVDADGVCVGILSAWDYLIRVSGGDWPDRRMAGNPGCAHLAWPQLACDAASDVRVDQCMTADPYTVAPKTSIGELARAMVDAHIHRIVVVDHAGRPTGIVSSTDILAAMADSALRSTQVRSPEIAKPKQSPFK